VPPETDTKRANVARVYDYWLGGDHNFLADQGLGRAVRLLAASGIRQFLDIGSGIPTQANVHEVAQQAAPGSRVVYVDVDPSCGRAQQGHSGRQ
jgi:S-adenosyl methyltransferase